MVRSTSRSAVPCGGMTVRRRLGSLARVPPIATPGARMLSASLTRAGTAEFVHGCRADVNGCFRCRDLGRGHKGSPGRYVHVGGRDQTYGPVDPGAGIPARGRLLPVVRTHRDHVCGAGAELDVAR